MFFGRKKLAAAQAENARLRALLENLQNAPVPENIDFSENWYKPAGYSWKLCDDILDGVHCLIAGTTGSGKSVLINSIIYSALISAPSEKQFILCDPKIVELSKYKKLPHVLRYESDAAGIISALDYAADIMRQRYKAMDAAGSVRFSDGPEIYIVIDEIADLMLSAASKAFTRKLQEILQIGRAAGLHAILSTQAPSRAVVPAVIQLNCPQRVALRCASAIESRQITNAAGAELLPDYGKGIFYNNGRMQRVDIPLTPAEDIAARVAFWEAQI